MKPIIFTLCTLLSGCSPTGNKVLEEMKQNPEIMEARKIEFLNKECKRGNVAACNNLRRVIR